MFFREWIHAGGNPADGATNFHRATHFKTRTIFI